jgi:hypothetical protein
MFDAGIQGSGSPTSCAQTENVVIVVTLPMSRTVFIAIEDKYIASVATTAGVIRENVKILSIDEISGRSSKILTRRLLLATSVRVQTSVLIEIGQRSNIKDQSVLNSNLNKNGLPSGTLIVQSTYLPADYTTTPAPGAGSFAGSGSDAASASDFPIGAIVGGTVGFSGLLVFSILAHRLRKRYKACHPAPPPLHSELKSSIIFL